MLSPLLLNDNQFSSALKPFAYDSMEVKNLLASQINFIARATASVLKFNLHLVSTTRGYISPLFQSVGKTSSQSRGVFIVAQEKFEINFKTQDP